MKPISGKKQLSKGCMLAAVLWLGYGPAFCADTPPPPVKQDAKPAAKVTAFDTISYKDSGGFTGRGTGKSLVVTSDGKLEVKPRNGPAATVQLEQQELAELAKAVAAVDWQAVQPQYRSRGADLMINDLSITINGKMHETHVDQLAKPPAELKALFARLNALYRKNIAAPKK